MNRFLEQRWGHKYRQMAVIANLVMEDVEQRALASVPVSLSFWKRFIDDVISAVSRNEIDILLQHLNSIEPSIQFTV